MKLCSYVNKPVKVENGAQVFTKCGCDLSIKNNVGRVIINLSLYAKILKTVSKIKVNNFTVLYG